MNYNNEKLVAFIAEYGPKIMDKFLAILILAGEDAAQIKAVWDLWEGAE